MAERPVTRLRADRLGLGRALGSRLLPALVAAMTFLAALALAGMVGASQLAGRWQDGAGTLVTVQVPQPGEAAAGGAGGRLDQVEALLDGDARIAAHHRLDDTELQHLLEPWLGDGTKLDTLPLPAVVQVRLRADDAAAGLPPGLSAAIANAAPGTLVEANGVWGVRLARLAASLQACAALALLLVGLVAAGVIAVAARASLGAKRQTVEIVHGLGAAPGDIAGRFARRASVLCAIGGVAGSLAALPVLVALARLAAPFSALPKEAGDALVAAWQARLPAAVVTALRDSLPSALWRAIPALPLGATAIGWAATQATVRAWLRRL